MLEREHTDGEERQEPSGRPLTEEEWIELMNKHDRLNQYAKKRREKRREEKNDGEE